jgi:hypothetical protein
MAVDERSRRELYEKLEAALGPKPADTAMSLLPPVGWADVATKQDIAMLDLKIDAMEDRIVSLVTWRLVVGLGVLLSVLLGVIVPFVA